MPQRCRRRARAGPTPHAVQVVHGGDARLEHLEGRVERVEVWIDVARGYTAREPELQRVVGRAQLKRREADMMMTLHEARQHHVLGGAEDTIRLMAPAQLGRPIRTSTTSCRRARRRRRPRSLSASWRPVTLAMTYFPSTEKIPDERDHRHPADARGAPALSCAACGVATQLASHHDPMTRAEKPRGVANITTLRRRGRPARGPRHRDIRCQTRTLAAPGAPMPQWAADVSSRPVRRPRGWTTAALAIRAAEHIASVRSHAVRA